MQSSRESVEMELSALGIKRGDIVLVNADLAATGVFFGGRRETMRAWVDILVDLVGRNGLIVCPAFSRVFLRWRKDPSTVFHSGCKSTSGALSSALLADPRSVRSGHPTNSYVAIGGLAAEFLKSHDEGALSYEVGRRVCREGGKQLMLGTVDRTNAPIGLHCAQEVLGITLRHPLRGIYQTYVKSPEELRTYTKWDVGGCSGGGYKQFADLAISRGVHFGLIGDAFSAVIDAKKSFDIAVNRLSADRAAYVCDDPRCLSCRGRWSVSGIKVLSVYMSWVSSKAIRSRGGRSRKS
jgi:aminoglycoside 3-N-acetyltransferase